MTYTSTYKITATLNYVDADNASHRELKEMIVNGTISDVYIESEGLTMAAEHRGYELVDNKVKAVLLTTEITLFENGKETTLQITSDTL